MNEEDPLAVFAGIAGILIVFGSAIAGTVALGWDRVSQWLVDHQILTLDNPLITLPGDAGAGLDAPRIVIAVALLLLLAAASISLRRSRLRRPRLPRDARQRR